MKTPVKTPSDTEATIYLSCGSNKGLIRNRSMEFQDVYKCQKSQSLDHDISMNTNSCRRYSMGDETYLIDKVDNFIPLLNQSKSFSDLLNDAAEYNKENTGMTLDGGNGYNNHKKEDILAKTEDFYIDDHSYIDDDVFNSNDFAYSPFKGLNNSFANSSNHSNSNSSSFHSFTNNKTTPKTWKSTNTLFHSNSNLNDLSNQMDNNTDVTDIEGSSQCVSVSTSHLSGMSKVGSILHTTNSNNSISYDSEDSREISSAEVPNFREGLLKSFFSQKSIRSPQKSVEPTPQSQLQFAHHINTTNSEDLSPTNLNTRKPYEHLEKRLITPYRRYTLTDDESK